MIPITIVYQNQDLAIEILEELEKKHKQVFEIRSTLYRKESPLTPIVILAMNSKDDLTRWNKELTHLFLRTESHELLFLVDEKFPEGEILDLVQNANFLAVPRHIDRVPVEALTLNASLKIKTHKKKKLIKNKIKNKKLKKKNFNNL